MTIHATIIAATARTKPMNYSAMIFYYLMMIMMVMVLVVVMILKSKKKFSLKKKKTMLFSPPSAPFFWPTRNKTSPLVVVPLVSKIQSLSTNKINADNARNALVISFVVLFNALWNMDIEVS